MMIRTMSKAEERRELFNNKWIALLCKHGNFEEFMDIVKDAVSIPLAIMRYRSILMDRGVGRHITDKHLKYGNIAKEEVLQNYLQELFLEPISIEHIEFFYKNSVKRGYRSLNDAVEELYRKHLKDPNSRFLSIALVI